MEVSCPLSAYADSTRSEASREALREQVNKLKEVSYGVFACVVVTTGLISNLINLAVLTRPTLKGVTFIYLTWLAVADLLTLLVSVSSLLRLTGTQPRTYTSALYFAHLEIPLVNAFMAVSVFIVTALTVERYFSVCLPTRFKELHNPRLAKIIIGTAYIMSFLVYVPVAFQKSPVSLKDGYLACDTPSVITNHGFRAYLIIKEVMVRIGPVVLVTILNTAIILTFRRTMKTRLRLLTPGEQATRTALSEERRLVILLVGVVVQFVICMTPAAILTLLHHDGLEHDYRFQVFRAVANCLELLNSSLNFFVYCLCSSEIRRTFVHLVLRPWRWMTGKDGLKVRSKQPVDEIFTDCCGSCGSELAESRSLNFSPVAEVVAVDERPK